MKLTLLPFDPLQDWPSRRFHSHVCGSSSQAAKALWPLTFVTCHSIPATLLSQFLKGNIPLKGNITKYGHSQIGITLVCEFEVTLSVSNSASQMPPKGGRATLLVKRASEVRSTLFKLAIRCIVTRTTTSNRSSTHWMLFGIASASPPLQGGRPVAPSSQRTPTLRPPVIACRVALIKTPSRIHVLAPSGHRPPYSYPCSTFPTPLLSLPEG